MQTTYRQIDGFRKISSKPNVEKRVIAIDLHCAHTLIILSIVFITQFAIKFVIIIKKIVFFPTILLLFPS